MKTILKIAGTAALAVILVCNLEYTLFTGDIKNTPNKALADWWGGGTHYCGSSPSTYSITGYWQYWNQQYWTYYRNNTPAWPVYITGGGYTSGFYAFTPDNNGYDCGPVRTTDCCGVTSPGVPNPFPAPYYTTTQTSGWGPY